MITPVLGWVVIIVVHLMCSIVIRLVTFCTFMAICTVCRTATVSVRSVFMITWCIRSIAVAIIIGSMIVVRSTIRRVLTDCFIMVYVPLIRFFNNLIGLLRPVHSRFGYCLVSGHHHGLFTRFNGKPYHVISVYRFCRLLTVIRFTISDSGGLCPVDDWLQVGCSV